MGNDVVGSGISYIEVLLNYVPEGTKEKKTLNRDVLCPVWELKPERAKYECNRKNDDVLCRYALLKSNKCTPGLRRQCRD